jgi:hypothetical protein
LTVGDTLDGGAGADTLTIADITASSAAGVPSSVTVKGIESVTVTSTGAVGSTSTTAVAQKAYYVIDAASITIGDKINFTVGAVATSATASATTNTNLAHKFAEALIAQGLNAYVGTVSGTTFTADTNQSSGSGTVVEITAPVAGTALPAIVFNSATIADQIPAAPASTSVANVANVAAATAASYSVSGWTDLASFTATSAGGASISAAGTTDVTVTNSGGVAKVSGGKAVTITTTDSIDVLGAKGAVVATTTGVPATKFAEAVPATGVSSSGVNPAWTSAAGISITGGTTVNVTAKAATTSATANAAPTSYNSTTIKIGAQPNVTTNQTTGAETISNLAASPSGDVDVNVSTPYTDAKGLADIAYGTGVATIYTNGSKTVSLKGALGGSAITDVKTQTLVPSTGVTAVPGTSTLETVNLTGVTTTNNTSQTVTIKSDAISTVSVVDSKGVGTGVLTVSVTNSGVAKANQGTMNLSVGNSTVTVSNATTKSVAVTGVNSAKAAVNYTEVATGSPSTLTLTAAEATSLSFAGTSNITLASSTLSKVATITASGSGELDLGTATGYAKLTLVDASAATGKVTASIGTTIDGTSPDTDFDYKGGSGVDTVTLTGTMTTGTDINGAVITNTIDLGAGDDVLLSSSGAISTGATANGGAGNDTISSLLLNLGNSTRITNFEYLGLDTASSGSYDTDLLAGATGLVSLTDGATYTNVEKEQSYFVNKNIGTGTTTLSFTTANVAGTADAYSVTFNAAGATAAASATSVDAGTLVIEGIENVTIASGASKGYVNNTIDLTDAKLKTVTITGEAYKTTLGFAGTNGTNSATAGVGGAVSLIDGSAYTGILVVDTTNVVENNSATGFTVKGGAGKDLITVDGVSIIDGGANDDTITVKSGAAGSTLTGGAGNDLFDLSAAAYDTSSATTKAATVTKIADYGLNDTLQFGTTGSLTYLQAVAGVAAATSVTGAIDAALTELSTGTAGWFTYGANTYVVWDGSSSDVAVQLVGAIALTASTTSNPTGLVGEA